MPELTDHEYKQVSCGHCGHEIRVPVYCRNRFCPHCSRARAWKIRDRMTHMLKNVVLRNNDNFRLLTLTIKNQPDLKPMCKQMLKSFKKLRNRKFWKPAFPGGCFIIEITGYEGYWHAHLHVLLQGKYVPQAIILNHWRQINGSGGVYIKTCDKKGVLYYLTKYLTKEATSEDDSVLISNCLKDFRLFQPFGSWHALIQPYKKRNYPCPDCNSTIWIPDHTLFSMASRSGCYSSPSKGVMEEARARQETP